MFILARVMHPVITNGSGSSKKKKQDPVDALLPLAVQCLVCLLRACKSTQQLAGLLTCLPAVAHANTAAGAAGFCVHK